MSKPKAAGPRCPHNDCQYRARDVLGNPRPWGCNYSDITGHTRNMDFGGICPPDKCPFYVPGERKRLRVSPFASCVGSIVDTRELIKRGPHYDWEKEAVPMWMAGASDADVAAALGCGLTYAGKIRRQMGILKKNDRDKAKQGMRPELLAQLYKAGLNDVQIAQGFGVYPGVVARWREKEDLPPNGNKIKSPEKAREIFNIIIKEEGHE